MRRVYLPGLFFLLQVQVAISQYSYLYPDLVKRFYAQRNEGLFWFRSDSNVREMSDVLFEILQTAQREGVLSDRDQESWICKHRSLEELSPTLENDKRITDQVFSALLVHLRGYPFDPPLLYNALSKATQKEEEEWVVQALSGVYDATSLAKLFIATEPIPSMFRILRQRYLSEWDPDSRDRLRKSMNLLRWVGHFRFRQFILVDRSRARLYLFDRDTIRMTMRVVLGKAETPTPTFAAWAQSVVLYPYWHVPESILYGEFIPKIIRDRSWLKLNRMEVVGDTGLVIDPRRIRWSAYRHGGFPYLLRQRTGCDNSLGVFKIDVQTPFSVFLHDTNHRAVFQLEERFLSHGCIRLEDPIGLGIALLGDRLDADRLRACLTDQIPERVLLSEPLPIILVDDFFL